MDKNSCYNYDWFVMWLSRHIHPALLPQTMISAEYISRNFTRRYFDVSEELVVEALESLGYSCYIEQNKKCFNICISEDAKTEFLRWSD